MYTGNLIFSQVMAHLPMHTFRRCVQRYRGHHKVKTFTCLDQFLCLAFAQLTYRESLRDIEACLRAQHHKLYHMGIRGGISRNTLAHANQTRDWRIYADFAQSLIHTARQLVFLTNNFALPAHTITQLYRCCWQVELFFKWIKQHLRIKAFYGTSENAVKTQIWTAVAVYVLVAIIKKRLNINLSLYTMLQILSVSVFEKMPLVQILTNNDYNMKQTNITNQLILFD